MSFVGEIRRRKVFQVAVVYAVVAWLLIQIIDVVNDPLSLPAWFDTVAIVLLMLGLPIAIILAWAFDITPAGVVRTPDLDVDTGTGVPVGAPHQPTQSPEQVSSSPPARSVAPPPGVLPNSVAVLPLENLSPNPDDAYFAAGIHEEILNCLTKIKDLSVIARTSVKRYADTDKSIAEIAEELGVGTVMEGSVRYAGERVRVTAQLIDAVTEDHLWSEVYERDLADVFAIQADIAAKIAEALEAEFSVAEKESLDKLPTTSPEAYALYLRAMAILQEHGLEVGGSPELRSSSQSYLDRAIVADPDFTLAYVQRARIAVFSLNLDPGTRENYASRRKKVEDLALRDLEKALALDPTIGAAHGVLARIHQYNWRGSEALEAYGRAVQLSPNDPDVLIDYAVFCAFSGRTEEAIRLGQRALTLDPNSGPRLNLLALIYLAAGDPDAGIESLRRATELSPAFSIGRGSLATWEAVRGNHAEALNEARIAEQLFRGNTNPTHLGELVNSYGRVGHREDAERLFHQLEEIAETRRIPAAAWVLAYLGLGDDEQALHWLTRAADTPEPYEGYFALMLIKNGSHFDPVLDEPRFQAVRDRLGYKD